MTEAEWLACEQPDLALELVRSTVSVRKLRLYACACCWRALRLISDDRSRKAVDAAELLADGKLSRPEWAAAEAAAVEARTEAGGPRGLWDAATAAVIAVSHASGREDAVHLAKNAAGAVRWATRLESVASEAAECVGQTDLLREIFGNPFRPVTFEAAWRTDTAESLAKGMNESREFSAMPILADALQDAGCDNDDVLNHCRDEKQPHVRGCWVVDLVLGKS